MTQERARVLVVDDNAALADNLREILEDAGYAVTCAATLADARRAFEGISVALIDLRLPDGEGTALAAELREKNPEAEAIVLTGHATVESAAQAVRSGASAYLLKPLATGELLLTIERALRQVRLKREKQQFERRAQVAEKLAAVGTMTAGLSHEIRNPLNAAGLQLQLLEKRLRKLPAELQPNLLEPMLLVRDEIRRLDHILEDFLQFARPVAFVPRPVDVSELLRKVEALFGGDAAERSLRLEFTTSGPCVVQGDEGRLRQVVVNLVMNALQATPAGGAVHVQCETVADAVVLRVDDSGPGVPVETRQRIFEPFFTTKAGGSGLGLPIVHAIVLQHGGTIEAAAAPGGGARFIVRLPTR